MEKVIKLTDTQARSMYPTAAPEFKTMLEANFGGKEFFQQKITDRVKTYEDACDILGISVSDVFCPRHDTPDDAAYKQLKVIAAALNEGWTPDWKDTNQAKFYPWFEMDKNRSNNEGFRLDGVHERCTVSAVGSRLCFRSRELAQYAAKQFLGLYQQFFTI